MSRRELRKGLDAHFSSVISRIGLPLNGGLSFSWPVMHVRDALPHVLAHCPGFKHRFVEALAVRPSSATSPWRLVLYVDEITPGNVLRPDNHRKISAFYYSWIELGDFLRNEEAWLLAGVLRTDVAKNTCGGISAAVRGLLSAAFTGDLSVSSAGIPINGNMFFCRFCRLLADDAAGKAVWGVKGAAGLRCCMDCLNVVHSGGTDLAGYDATGYLVGLGCSDRAKLDRQTDRSWWHSYDTLAVAASSAMSKADFESMEKSMGMTYDRHNILADKALREHVKPSSNARDPMHIVLAGGVMSWEIMRILSAWHGVRPRFKWAELESYARTGWCFPCPRGRQSFHHCFSPGREKSSKEADIFKAMASETLAVYPIIRDFLHHVIAPTGLIPLERASFLATCDLVDCMMAAKLGLADGDALAAASRHCLRSHVAAYGDQFLKPKHHYLMHLHEQYKEDGFYLDCFTHERKHQVIKAAADGIKNTSTFEESVLLMALNATYLQMAEFASNGLAGPTHESKRLGGIVCRRIRVQGVVVGCGDVVVLPGIAIARCFVRACFQDSEGLALLVSPMTFDRQVTPHSTLWNVEADVERLSLHGVPERSRCWYFAEDDRIITIP